MYVYIWYSNLTSKRNVVVSNIYIRCAFICIFSSCVVFLSFKLILSSTHSFFFFCIMLLLPSLCHLRVCHSLSLSHVSVSVSISVCLFFSRFFSPCICVCLHRCVCVSMSVVRVNIYVVCTLFEDYTICNAYA